jgi:hypothetical protein
MRLKTKNSELIEKKYIRGNKYLNKSYIGYLTGLTLNSPLAGSSRVIGYGFQLKDNSIYDFCARSSLPENLGMNTGMHEYFHKFTNDLLVYSNENYTPALQISINGRVYDIILIDAIVHDGDKVAMGYILYGIPHERVYVSNWKLFLQDLSNKKDLLQSITNLLSGNYNQGGSYVLTPPHLAECNGRISERGIESIDIDSCKFFYKTTPIGSMIDTNTMDLLITSAGTLGEVGASVLLYLIGRAVKKKRPLLGSFTQMFSVGVNLNAIYYPINSAIAYLRGASYGGDWEYIYQHININPAIIAGAISAIYPLAVLTLYLKDRRSSKVKERAEALERLIADRIVEKGYVNSLIKNYVNNELQKSYKLPLFSRLLNTENKIINQLKKYKISDYEGFEAVKNDLVARFSKEKSLIKRIKLKREINNIEKLRTKVLNSVAKDEKINDIIKREIELTNMLFKKYFDYKEDPKKLSKELKEKLNVSDEFTNLERRLDEYYDSFGKSATATIYGTSSIIK